MKKKILTLILTLMLLMSMSVPAWATNLSGNGTGGSTQLTYTVAPSFTVTVPAAFDITTTAQEKAVIVATGGLIAFDETLTITATSENEDGSNTFRLLDQSNVGNYLPYTVSGGDPIASIISGGTVLTANATQVNSGITKKISFELDAAATIAGTYKDTITFTVTVT